MCEQGAGWLAWWWWLCGWVAGWVGGIVGSPTMPMQSLVAVICVPAGPQDAGRCLRQCPQALPVSLDRQLGETVGDRDPISDDGPWSCSTHVYCRGAAWRGDFHVRFGVGWLWVWVRPCVALVCCPGELQVEAGKHDQLRYVI